MFFLLRMAFWFSLVLLALPLGAAGGAADVGPFQALIAARDAVSDVAGLCQRKPDVCRTGRAAMETVGVRAREGSRIAIELLDSRFGDAANGAEADFTTGSVEKDAEPDIAAQAAP